YSFSKPRQDVTIIPYDNGYYAEYLVYSFSEFWINGGGPGKNQAVPYMVDSFTAKLVDTTGFLQWKIFPGSLVDSFVIEKGTDGSNFTELIGSVKAIGNITDYQFTDLHLHEGLNYYRVRLVTPDGNIQYSPIRTIAYVKNNIVTGVFPNPVTNGKLNVNTTNNCRHIDLYDVLGRFIKGEDKTGVQNTFSFANLARGVYLLKIYTNNGNSIFKILVE
ncbi:MAG: T9SS type A sorting domain-containing protein, partial [Chitinophagales bacterium]